MYGKNIDKKSPGRGDNEDTKKLMKLAEKDPMTHIELELMNKLDELYNEAKDAGFTGSFNDWLDTQPTEKLERILKSDGGLVDFSSLTPGQMKAIFKSENGFDAKSPQELVRGVKMYLKNLDIDGIPFGAFDKK